MIYVTIIKYESAQMRYEPGMGEKPVIGAFIYMLFTSTGQSRKEYRKFEDAHRRLLPYLEQPEAGREELKAADVDTWSQANYLYQTAGMPCTGGHAAYYPLGEELYISKMDFYLETLDRQKKKENENPSVGMILWHLKMMKWLSML